MKTADEFLSEGAATFKERNKTYGNNYLNVGSAMASLFPEGVTLKTADDWNRMHIFLLGLVKLSRYANNWDAGGHADSMHDNTVYSAMLESIDAEIAGRTVRVEFDTPVYKPPVTSGSVTFAQRAREFMTNTPRSGESAAESAMRTARAKAVEAVARADGSFLPCNHCVTTDMCKNEVDCYRTLSYR